MNFACSYVPYTFIKHIVNMFSARLFTSFLHPSGRISHFFIPFHALSTSSSAERDLKTQGKILQLLQGPRPDGFIRSLADEFDGIKNIQLKTYLVSSILTKEQNVVNSEEAAALISCLVGKCSQEEKNVPLEQKLYGTKLLKLRQLVSFFQKLEKLEPSLRHVISEDTGMLSQLSSQISVRVEHLETLLKMINNETVPLESQLPELTLADFLLSFELEGELQTSERYTIVTYVN